MAKPNGGPAFGGEIDDVFINTDHPGVAPMKFKRVVAGMTLRDYFAAAALGGMCQRFNSELIKRYLVGESDDREATVAYRLADAMLKEREK